MKRVIFKRRKKRTGIVEKGMTLIEIMLVLTIIAVVMGFLVGPKVLSMFRDSKGKTAKIMADKFHYEGYTAWALANPDKSCPGTLQEVTKYMNKKDVKDPWGQEFIMLCGDNAPKDSPDGFGVMSKGEDKKQGTEDDVKSWVRGGSKSN